jgi:hypothetical protein
LPDRTTARLAAQDGRTVKISGRVDRYIGVRVLSVFVTRKTVDNFCRTCLEPDRAEKKQEQPNQISEEKWHS